MGEADYQNRFVESLRTQFSRCRTTAELLAFARHEDVQRLIPPAVLARSRELTTPELKVIIGFALTLSIGDFIPASERIAV